MAILYDPTISRAETDERLDALFSSQFPPRTDGLIGILNLGQNIAVMETLRVLINTPELAETGIAYRLAGALYDASDAYAAERRTRAEAEYAEALTRRPRWAPVEECAQVLDHAVVLVPSTRQPGTWEEHTASNKQGQWLHLTSYQPLDVRFVLFEPARPVHPPLPTV